MEMLNPKMTKITTPPDRCCITNLSKPATGHDAPQFIIHLLFETFAVNFAIADEILTIVTTEAPG
jgi:hypothetical protein